MDEDMGDKGSEHATRQRDRRLRRQLLATLFQMRISPSGWTGATTLRDTVDGVMPNDQCFESECHCIGMCRDLSISGLIEERKISRRRGEEFGLRHLEYRITAAGLALHLQSAPPNSLVDDDRI